jgi:Fe-S cluster biosynthesis and repair protein YggX
MVTLTLTNEQVEQLIEQLPPDRQRTIYQRLARKEWSRWIKASDGAEDAARSLANKRSLDWDAMNEDERMAFVNELVHEDRTAV